ncbi:unnamed protein product [Clonostachys rosea f. rosea IK726]|uniref:Uncharacterized protein n=1 Tax=Clonostachys rosea f. rosea IK726 TaxID=1349383 RepID=A0ACA9UKU5_BIOOC|nr:unnamed protein product [Clonostachys rosea f. rosea IK726]
MDLTPMLARREASKSPGLGLGWLLAIGLGGGLLLAVAVGLLFGWWYKRRFKPTDMVVYTNAANLSSERSQQFSSGKRGFLSQSSFSRMSSRLSMTLPPVLPPLPTYNSFTNGAGKKERGRSWVDEEALHGPRVRRLSFRDSWFSKEGWLSGSPTLPDLDEPPREKLAQAPPDNQKIEVQKRQAPINESQTEPDLPSLTALPRGRPRIPPLMPIRAYATESDLRDILASTEQRLRDGISLSPEKNSRKSPKRGGSPTKTGSPSKTPHSGRTVVSGHSNGRMTPSPSKRGSQPPGTPTPIRTHSRNASITSIGSVANSLIRQATAELELPGGMSSPSRLRGQEWTAPQQRQPIPQPQFQPHPHWQQGAMGGSSGRDTRPQEEEYLRRVSIESEVSSALSTLYSVGEPEEETRRTETDDPFVVKGTRETRPQLNGPRPLRRAKTIAGLQIFDESAVPAPLRTVSVNARTAARPQSEQPKMSSLTPVSSTRLPPPSISDFRNQEEVRPKSALTPEMTSRSLFLSSESSEASLVSCSVHSVESNTSDEEEQTVTPKAENFPRPAGYRKDSSSPESYSTPIKRGGPVADAGLSSSPLDERQVLSMLGTQPQRELPIPPSCASARVNSCIIQPGPSSRPTSKYMVISPPPISRSGSVSSSVYDVEPPHEDQHTELPRCLGSTLSIRGQTVGSTIAELRRTNSVVSSYSVASLASTFLSDAAAESAAIPAIRGGGFSPLRTNSKSAAAGNRNYLSLGGMNALKGSREARQQQSYVARSRSAVTTLEKTEANKENQVLNMRTVRFELPDHTREGRLGPSLTVPLADTTSIVAPGSSADEQQRRAQPQHQSNQSIESTGLYDKDGFLIPSPAKNSKGGRWRM